MSCPTGSATYPPKLIASLPSLQGLQGNPEGAHAREPVTMTFMKAQVLPFKRRLRIGRDRDPGVVETIVLEGIPRTASGTPASNPLVAVYGPGPTDATCRSCEHLFLQTGIKSRIYKCDLRYVTHGAVTDHRARWDACAMYYPRDPEQDAPDDE